ncbi:hypothetical protein [Streptomyces sp. NPDC046862]|uniref:hypothetical protein n=1 Tax=Streptomyces sp. NPDC046862 TaxID=3154603 RepID=UPI0034516D65
MKTIRRLAAALTLAALTAFGALTALDGIATPADTTWGAPADNNDTTWGSPTPDIPVCCRVSADATDGTPVTLLATARA